MANELVVEEAVPTGAPGEVPGSGPEVPPEALPPEEGQELPEEPYGAQLLRKLHEDAALLLMEYDAAMGPLDNPDVRGYVTEVMKLIDRQILTAAEKCFKKQYKQLPPLVPEQAAEAEEGAYQGEETPEEEAAEEVVQEEAEPANVPPDGDPEAQEVVVEEEGKDYDAPVDADSGERDDAPAGAAMRGMYKGQKSLNGQKAAGQTDRNGKSLLHSISPLPGGKGFRVVESYGQKSRHVDLTVKGINKYLSGFKGQGAKSLVSQIAKGLNAGKSVRFKSAVPCPVCNVMPCECKKSLPGANGKAMPGTEEWEKYPLEPLPDHGPVDPAGSMDGEPTFGTQETWVTALLPEAQKLDEAFGQLTDLADGEVTWDELMRHKSFHYHKVLEGMYQKCAASCGYKGMDSVEAGGAEDQGNLDPEAMKHLKSLAAASNFLKTLAHSKDFGDPHRREAKFHAGNVKELLKAMGMGPEPTPTDHAEATYAEPGEMGEKDLDEMAKAMEDLAKDLVGEKKAPGVPGSEKGH